jgi:hypothetical protein
MRELEYLIKNGGLTPKRLLKKISRRGFGASILGGFTGAAALRLTGAPLAHPDFTVAIIPIPSSWLHRARTISVDITPR